MSTRGITKGNTRVDTAQLRKDLTAVNPIVRSTMSRAVPRNGRTPEHDEATGRKNVNPYKLEKLSNIISNNINAATDLRVITPYIDKAENIWRTILLFPNGKQAKILTYDTLSSARKNAKLHEELVKIWDEYYTNDYKIEKDLKKIVSDLLINTGSYALLTMSRAGLDYLINGSETARVDGNESFFGNESQAKAADLFSKDFIRNPVTGEVKVLNTGRFVRRPGARDVNSVTGVESIFGKRNNTAESEFNIFGDEDPDNVFGISITDNPAALYLQKFAEADRRASIEEVTGVESLNAMISATMGGNAETWQNNDDDGLHYTNPARTKAMKGADDPKATTKNVTEEQLEQISYSQFPARNIQNQAVQFVKPEEALSVAPYGRSITWHIPSEAIIPVHVAGSNGTHTDFIILIDPIDGSFLKATKDFEFYQDPSKSSGAASKSKQGSTNNLISSLKTIQEGRDCDFDMREFATVAEASVIRRLTQAIISGRSDNISIELDEMANKIFLQRIFRGQGVRCLYVPGESVTYMALNYNRLGVGQSLTQMAKMHIARLAALDLADAMANLQAATPHTQMTIRVNEKAPEPFADIANARAAWFAANPQLTSILSSAQLSVPQMVDALRENSLTVKVDAGDNPFIPVHDISTESMDNNNFRPVDENSRNDLLNKIANYYHLSKSWLDVSDDQNNFAIEALAEHQMLLNQVVNWQEELADFIIDFERKHATRNAVLMRRLITKIKDMKTLWVPDSKEVIEGSDEHKVKVLLTDFLNTVTVSFPAPTSVDTTAKIKDSLDVVKTLVDNWVDMAGHKGNLEEVAKLLNIDVSDSTITEDQPEGNGALARIKDQIRSVFMVGAYRRYNLPMPFDDIIAEGKGGGLASMVNSIVHQRQNIGDFLGAMTIGVNEVDAKILKEHAKKIEKAVASLLKAKDKLGISEETPDLDDNNAIPGDDDLTNTDDADLLGTGGDDPIADDPDAVAASGEDDQSEDAANSDGTDTTKNPDDVQPF